MNRLTYKLDEPIKTKYLNYEYKRIPDYDIDRGNYGRISDDMIFNKLGKLEDIEEELGIDLITLFKALRDGVFINEDGSVYKDCIKSIEHWSDGWGFISNDDYIEALFEDYGSTWALTREELENEDS